MLAETSPQNAAVTGAEQRPSRAPVIVIWALALLTAVGTAAVDVLDHRLAQGTADCSDRTCPYLGSAGAVLGTLST
jgi:hypothetical protein